MRTPDEVVDDSGRKIPKVPPKGGKIVEYSLRHLAGAPNEDIVQNHLT